MPKRWGTWKLSGLVLAVGIAGLVLAAGPSAPPQGPPAAVASCDQRMDAPQAAAGDVDPAGACRIMPECWADDDCDAICGPGQGKCIHNKCPIRICRCG